VHKVDEERKAQNAARRLKYKEEEDYMGGCKEDGDCAKEEVWSSSPKAGKCPGPYPKPAQGVPLGESETKVTKAQKTRTVRIMMNR